MKRIALFVIFMLFPASFLFAATHVVNPSGSIQAAINSAASGDTIVLADGTYTESGITNNYMNLLIKSASNDPAFCVIDCSGGAGITFQGSSSLVGVTVTHAAGSGIYVNTGNVKIQNCILSGNSTTGFGGGIFFNFASGTIEDCRIFENSAARGGGLALHSGTQIVRNCVISNNQATADGGGIYAEYSDLMLSSCLIADNMAVNGAGIFGYFPNSVLTECDIVKNHGDGVWANSGSWSIDHTIIALNEGKSLVSAGPRTITCSDFWNNRDGDWVGGIAGEENQGNNLNEDPLFCGPSVGNYTLCLISPCLTGPCGQIGCYSQGCDCAIGVEKSTWGGIKNLYH